MSLLIVLASLCFLMFVAYRGYSVILFAPIAALGAVIAALPGFLVVANALTAIPNPLVNEAITVSSLAGIPLEVLHPIASMASGGTDTLPHNGAVITLLAVTGLTHRVSYKDIFAITLIKTIAVFVAIAIFYLTGIV